MLKISRKIEYSLMALHHLVHRPQGALTTAKEVCDVYGAPFDVVAKVMQQLAHHEILKSEQGAKGGYLVQCDLSKYSFYDLVLMIEGPLGVVKCLHKESANNCELIDKCNIVSPISFINDRLVQFYKELPLSEVLRPGRKPLKTNFLQSVQV